MTSTALALHGSHGIDTEKPHVEVYQCQLAKESDPKLVACVSATHTMHQDNKFLNKKLLFLPSLWNWLEYESN